MSIIGLSRAQWDDIESKVGGFSLCPAGSGLLLEITEHREGTYEKDGKVFEYVTLACSHTDEAGIKHDHWEFFNLTDKDMPYLKGFIEKINRQDVFTKADAEWDLIHGTVFTADIKHRLDKKTKDMKSNMMRNTITAVSHDEGEEVEGWRDDLGLETEEEEVTKKKPEKKFKKATTSATRTGKKKKPVEEEEEAEEDDEDEEEEDDNTAPERSRRRARRAERED